MKITSSLFLLNIVCFSLLAQQQETDTISIYYNIGSFVADESELDKLQVNERWKTVSIISYTDYLGSIASNRKLSTNRALECRSRLIEKGLSSEQLALVEGRGVTGETLNSDEGIQENRRTDVIIQWQIETPIVEKEEIETPEETVVETILTEKVEESEVGDHLILDDLIFVPGQHYLIEGGNTTFKELLSVLRKNPKLKINIEGHICCNVTGEDGLDMATGQYNLSEARAEYIYDLLIQEGIKKERLSYEGFARQRPIFPDEITEAQKQANRRVEITILEK